MDRFIYTAVNSARELMFRQATNNHNLANSSTVGFRADLRAYSNNPVYGPGHPTRVFVEEKNAGVDITPAPHMTTGNNLHIAINGEGFIAVQGPDGKEAYTRSGDFRISSTGLLETSAGHLVMGNGGPIAIPPHEKLEIGADGTVSIHPLGQNAATLAIIDRIKFVNPGFDEIEKNDVGLITLKNGETSPVDADVRVTSGALENSNVNIVEAMVTMIDLARQFEMQVKMMKKAEEADAAASTIAKVA